MLYYAIIILIILIILYYSWTYSKTAGRERLKEGFKRGLQTLANTEIEFILNQPLQTHGEFFTRGYILDMRQRNDQTNNPQIQRQINNDYQTALAIMTTDDTFLRDIGLTEAFMIGVIQPNRKQEIIAQKVEKIKNLATDKRDFTERYIKESQTVANDTQNVHDTNINNSLKVIIQKLQTSKRTNFVSFNEIKPQLTSVNPQVLAVIEKGENHALFNITDKEVLELVWNRAYHPKNNTQAIHDALILLLNDCMDEKGGVVCISGRIGRILDALTLLDFEDNPALKTLDMYKNEIFQNAKKIIDDTLNEYKYHSKYGSVVSGGASDELENEFNDIIRGRLNEMVDAYGHVSGIDAIRADVLAAIL